MAGNRKGRALRIAIVIAALVAMAGGAGAATLTVDINGSGMYTKIQDAINNSNDGDVLLVYNGTYVENILLNKRITLKGYSDSIVDAINLTGGYSNPVIDAGGIGSGIVIEASGSTVENLKIRHAIDYGIRIMSDDNILFGNIISLNGNGAIDSYLAPISGGILIQGSSNKLINNIITSNSGGGIKLNGHFNLLEKNTISNGIYLNGANNNRIIGNSIFDGYFNANFRYRSDNNVIYHNNFFNGFDIYGANNTFDNGVEGNYWNGFTAADCNGDGIGEKSYMGKSDYLTWYAVWEAFRWYDVRPLIVPYGILFTYSVTFPTYHGLMNLNMGDIWNMGAGFTLHPIAIDAKSVPKQIWFQWKRNSVVYGDIVQNESSSSTCIIPSTDNSGVSNLTIFVTNITAGVSYDTVEFDYIWSSPYLPAPPPTISNLKNTTFAQTYIKWTWTDPTDSNFAKVMIYLDGIFQTNVSKGVQYFNATGLTPDTQHTISTHTVDTSGNINGVWVNHTARTAPVNTIPTILDPTLSNTSIYKQGTGTPDTITISYPLSDADGIASASLYYRLNSGALQQTSLTRSSGKLPSGYEWWNVTIGPFNNNGTVSFYLNATDRTGLSARNPYDGSNHSFSVITGTVLEPSLKIDNVVLTPANPIKRQNTKVDVVISNVGNAPNPAGTINLYFGVMDFKDKGAIDSIWASTELYGFNREFSVPEIKNGSSYTISFNDMVFLDSTIPDTLQVTLRYGSKRDRVYFYAKDINVIPDPSALLDCGSAVWDTVGANRIIAEAGIKWALVTSMEYSELAQALKSADENAESGDYASTANDLADITAFALEKHIESNAVYYQTLKTSENIVKPVMLIKGIFENGPRCTDVLFDSQYTAPYIKQIANALGSGIKALIVESPVDLIIEDESGNITGINRLNQSFENITDSALIVKGHKKIILLTGNASYRIRMNGTGSGAFNLTIVNPENNGSVSTITYREIPVNSQTSASLEFSNRSNFTMSIDQNGDGSTDAFLSPNATTRSTPPAVVLTSPQNNATYYRGQNITFSINVTNGTSPIKYRWASSIDGVIGNSSSFSISNLSLGEHVITSKVYDGAGFSNSTVLSLNILNETSTTPPSTGGDVVSRYAGSDGIVQRSEAVQAVMDYFNSMITRQEAIEVVMAYFTG